MLNHAFLPIGAKTNIFTVKLRSGERAHYKLTDYGVPQDARVLYVNYTPSGREGGVLFPAEIHGNVPTRPWPRHEVTLWPVPFGSARDLMENEVDVFVTWVPHTRHDDTWGRLVEAFQAYVAEGYTECLVPANVAVEASLTLYLTDYISKFVGRQWAERFLQEAATYSYQLNVVLPLITSFAGISPLPEQVRGLLNRLRDLRNQMAHRGKLDTELTKHEAAELLCAALFGFRYMRFIQSGLRLE